MRDVEVFLKLFRTSCSDYYGGRGGRGRRNNRVDEFSKFVFFINSCFFVQYFSLMDMKRALNLD